TKVEKAINKKLNEIYKLLEKYE
ncbi:hypothetical protein HG1285_12572, partial [Hydrogenivirga sp. 128-5-R1-1]